MGGPKPTAPTPTPAPALPTPSDPEVIAARDAQRKAAQNAGTFSGTLLTSGAGAQTPSENVKKRTLLGGG
jgi:hypothetical protein